MGRVIHADNNFAVEAQQCVVRNDDGDISASKNDLRSTVCCSIDAMPKAVRKIVSPLDPQVRDRVDS